MLICYSFQYDLKRKPFVETTGYYHYSRLKHLIFQRASALKKIFI